MTTRIRRLHVKLLSGVAALALSATAAFADGALLSLPEQPLAQSLKDVARATGVNILFTPDAVTDIKARALKGQMTARIAVNALLTGTNLQVVPDDSGGLIVRRKQVVGLTDDAKPRARDSAERPTAGQSGTSSDPREGQPIDQTDAPAEKVVVTGSRIRGAKQASPVVTITQDDMRKRGQTDLGQVSRALPQSFAGGQNPGVTFGPPGLGDQNVTGGSSLNLRGLGADATLTLLNGNRLPYDGFSQATDIAVVPLAAVDRIEILLDGASAIYGSDAVGGVANVILKRDFDGVELSGRWGEATEGGFEQQQYTAVGGTSWTSGGFLLAADSNRNTEITAGQREYLPDLPPSFSIYPRSEQNGLLFSGHQRFGNLAELSVDAFYTKRDQDEFIDFPAFGYNYFAKRSSIIWGVAPSLRMELPDDWSLKLYGAIGKNNAKSSQTAFLADGTLFLDQGYCNCNEMETAGIDSEGPLFDFGGGAARLAVGGGYRRNVFTYVPPSPRPEQGGEDTSRFAYGELYLPLLSEEQSVRFVRRLAISGALRFESYDSFGETTTPKVGAVWSVSSDIDLKTSWGKSFKTPTLNQQTSPVFVDLADAAFLGAPYPPGSGNSVLFVQGGNPGLTPERAETFTSGFALHPDFLPGFRIEANWFDVSYTDRVVTPINNLGAALTDPIYSSFVTNAPTIAQQNVAFASAGLPVGTFSSGEPPPPLGPYDPARVVAIIDVRYTNAAAQHFKGIDLSAKYAFEAFGGSFTANADGSWLDTKQTLIAGAPEQRQSGLVFFPAKFKGRIGAAWAREGLSLSANLNYVGSVKNTSLPATFQGDPFTTIDVVANYVFASSPFGGEIEMTLGVQNLFNENPPFMPSNVPGFPSYDSTNYSAVGRVANATVTVRY